MNYATDFGQFISDQRLKHSLRSVDLAKKLGISYGYLSQLEHGKRVCPDTALLKKLINIFELNGEESTLLYDLYAKASGQLCPDIVEYIQANEIVKNAIRVARDADASYEDWESFIKYLSEK